MQYALSTYSLCAYAEAGILPQLGCIAKAKELGYDAVEICGIWPHDGSSRLDYAKKLREECERLSMPVVAYATDGNLLCEDRPAEIKRLCREADIAKLLGAPKMRHDAAYAPSRPRSFARYLTELADSCREVTLYAEALGVRTMVENHGQFCQDSDRVELLVNTVDHKNFGLLCDMGNFLDADEDPARACGRIAPYVFHVHAKDFHVKPGIEPYPGEGFYATRAKNWIRGAIVGQGNVPVAQCLDVLMEAGYDGSVTVEFEGLEDPALACRIGLQNLRKMERRLRDRD